MGIILLIFLYLLLSTGGLILIKTGFNQFNFKTHQLEEYGRFITYAFQHKEIIFGFMIYMLSFLAWLVLLSKRQLTLIFPLVIGLSYTSIMFASVVFLKEEIDLFKILGIFLIGAGILCITKI